MTKLNSELARSIPAIDATRVTMARAPRSRTVALSDCIVTRADGTTHTMPSRTRNGRPTVQKHRTRPRPQHYTGRIMASDLPSIHVATDLT